MKGLREKNYKVYQNQKRKRMNIYMKKNNNKEQEIILTKKKKN